jgi:hypothetical protein
MLELAGRKAGRSPNGNRISFKRLAIEDIADPEILNTLGQFDLIFSDFDGLNCLRELDWLPEALAGMLKPGGNVIAVFMNPVCPMEILYFLARGRISRAFGRLRPAGLEAHIGDGVLVRTYFHPVHRVKRLFGTRFSARSVMAIGLTTPPTLMRDFYHRHQRGFRRLFGLEDRLAPIPPFNRLGDHVLMHFQLR